MNTEHDTRASGSRLKQSNSKKKDETWIYNQMACSCVITNPRSPGEKTLNLGLFGVVAARFINCPIL